MLALAKLAVQPPGPNALVGSSYGQHGGKGLLGLDEDQLLRIQSYSWPVFASVSWAGVMWLFRYYPETLQPSLRSSMTYMYVLFLFCVSFFFIERIFCGDERGLTSAVSFVVTRMRRSGMARGISCYITNRRWLETTMYLHWILSMYLAQASIYTLFGGLHWRCTYGQLHTHLVHIADTSPFLSAVSPTPTNGTTFGRMCCNTNNLPCPACQLKWIDVSYSIHWCFVLALGIGKIYLNKFIDRLAKYSMRRYGLVWHWLFAAFHSVSENILMSGGRCRSPLHQRTNKSLLHGYKSINAISLPEKVLFNRDARPI